MDLFTDEQKTLLYAIGLKVDDLSDEDKLRIKGQIDSGKIRIGTGQITLTEWSTIDDRIKRFVRYLFNRKNIPISTMVAIHKDANAELQMKSENGSFTMSIQYHTPDVPKKEEKGKELEWKAETYLEYIVFTANDEAIKQRLMDTIGVSLPDMEQNMMTALKPHHNKRTGCTKEQQEEWLSCSAGCNTAATEAITQEIESTAYILRCLAQSLMPLEGARRIQFSFDGELSTLTGRWKDDQAHIRLLGYGSKEYAGRLVMGFGPSASGKTHLTGTLLTLLRKADSTLPPVFLTIDGGKYRESSYTYDMVKRVAKNICAAGFYNLVAAGLSSVLGSSLFDSDIIKKSISDFLKSQKDKGLKIHLYIPETLGSCVVGSCESQYQSYKDITQDQKWIGLLIWQHKFGKDCNFPDGYKCVGCTESGKSREKSEGKKYSNTAWDRSMRNGQQEFIKAPGGSYKIHNSGGKQGSRGVILDYSKNIPNAKKEVFKGLEGSIYLADDDVKQEIKQFINAVKELKERVEALGKSGFAGDKKKETEAKLGLKQRYDALHTQLNGEIYGVYRALYPDELNKSDEIMKKLEERVSKFGIDIAVWKNKHDSITVNVYYVRHGYSCANLKRNTASGFRKFLKSHTFVSDPSLAPLGIKQAEELGKNIAEFVTDERKVDLVCTSQLYRAIQTGLLLRAALPSEQQIPLHVVPYLCEEGITFDNQPDKFEKITEEDKKTMATNGPVEIDTTYSVLNKSNIPAFVEGPLSTWLRKKREEVPDKKVFTVFVVAHSTLLKHKFEQKLDNCQLLPVVYSFTPSGFLLNSKVFSKEDQETMKKQFPSPYSGTKYTISPDCSEKCNELEDISKGIDVEYLHQVSQQCIQGN